jgi:hypothetical protein
MEFKKEDLLNYDELVILFSALSPSTRAEIISSKLKKYMFINKFNKICLLQSNLSYKIEPLNDIILYTKTSIFINKSYNNISNEARDLLMSEHKQKGLLKNMGNNGIDEYKVQLIYNLKDSTIEFDNYTWQIHFNNGYMNLKTNVFHQRVLGQDYITYFIPRDYILSTEKEKTEIMEHIKKIYPDQKDRQCILSMISKCLIGQPNIDQNTFFLIGPGSAGKSFILELSRSSLGKYVEEFQSDTFENGNNKRDKIFNELSEKTYIRVFWVNEFSDKKISDSDFKNFCDGTIKTTKLYQDGSHTVNVKCKLIGTCNIMPNLQINSGSARRFCGYTHSSKFTDNLEEINNEKHIYLKDRYLLNKIVAKQGLLNAWVDLLAEQCNLVYENKAPQLTKNFKETSEGVVSTNDIVQDFIDSVLIITNNVDNRIGKNEMRTEFLKKFPDKHITVQQLISSLKEKGLIYEPKFRVNNIQGCFTQIKLRTFTDDDENEDNPLEFGIIPIKKTDKDYINEIEKLKSQIKLLQNQLKEKNEIIEKQPIKTINQQIDEHIDRDKKAQSDLIEDFKKTLNEMKEVDNDDNFNEIQKERRLMTESIKGITENEKIYEHSLIDISDLF